MKLIINLTWKRSLSSNLFPETLLNVFRNSPTSIKARNIAIVTMKKDSSINCIIIVDLSAPATFFIPISFPLADALAVERLIKFMHAMKSTNIAISVKIRTAITGPLFSPKPNWECKWMSSKGKRTNFVVV